MGGPAGLQELNSTPKEEQSSRFPLGAILQAALRRKPTPLRASSISVSPALLALPSSGDSSRHGPVLPAGLGPAGTETRQCSLQLSLSPPLGSGALGGREPPPLRAALHICLLLLQLCQVSSERSLTCSHISSESWSGSQELFHPCPLSSGREHPRSRWEEGKCQQQAAPLAGWGKTSPNAHLHTQSDELRENVGPAVPGNRDLVAHHPSVCHCFEKSS